MVFGLGGGEYGRGGVGLVIGGAGFEYGDEGESELAFDFFDFPIS